MYVCIYLFILLFIVEEDVTVAVSDVTVASAASVSKLWFVCLVGWFLNVLVNNWAISRTGPKTNV